MIAKWRLGGQKRQLNVTRLLITGAAGCGTSTVGQAIAERISAKFLDADDYFWLPTDPPYLSKRPADLRLAAVLEALDRSSPAVIAGSIVGWGAPLEDSLSAIVYLWVPPDVRVERLRERESRRFGAPLDGFLEWAAQYDEGKLPGRSRARHERWLSERNCPVHRLEGSYSAAETEARVLAMLAGNADMH